MTASMLGAPDVWQGAGWGRGRESCSEERRVCAEDGADRLVFRKLERRWVAWNRERLRY